MEMTRRERVLKTLNFETPDRLPKDLGGMASTGISCFAYPRLVKALGLPERLPKVFDTFQMLALPDQDVLDALDCDVAFVAVDQYSNILEEPQKWQPFDFGGRLPALVLDPTIFQVESDGTIRRTQGNVATMPPSSYVFDEIHGGQPLNLSGELVKEDLDQLAERFQKERLTENRVQSIASYCQKVREATDRAILFNGAIAGFEFRGGIAAWSMLCMLEKDYVNAVHELLTTHYIRQVEALLPAIKDSVDVIWVNSDDHGAQDRTFLPPKVFRELYLPYYQRINQTIHRIAPQVKTFLHSCGAIYAILDDVIAAGFDVLNPVQWTAGNQGYQAWKDKCRGRIALWGGGVNAQRTLPFGTPEEVYQEAKTVSTYLSDGNGFVFNSIHNILAEITPENVIALYKAAKDVVI
ncbi:putative methyltransferase [Candidatus Moduliflexus flocculans]|uniref:Putative methyltransferase n=1 Tax=Candidatus Moduliflexus flocculans TaxID=1499966 RepID=A0A081BRN7_9BACT|nr:putative methyltransferase [Candidatus Moduliflexus flocculans]